MDYFFRFPFFFYPRETIVISTAAYLALCLERLVKKKGEEVRDLFVTSQRDLVGAPVHTFPAFSVRDPKMKMSLGLPVPTLCLHSWRTQQVDGFQLLQNLDEHL